MKPILCRLRKYQVWLLWLLPAVALAVVVTQAQVVQAVLNSPNASSALKQLASDTGALAQFESSLKTTASNSCCYGILQLDKNNIKAVTGLTGAEYLQLGLQDQVNAWATIVSQELKTTGAKTLSNLMSNNGTFSGQTVDAAMVLGCLQLGSGNCNTVVKSGICNTVLDGNKKSICDFANGINKIAGNSSGGSGSTGTGTGSGSSGSTGTPISTVACVRDASGNCKPMDQAMADAFEVAAGFSMSQLRTTIFGIIAAGMLLLSIGIIKDVWRQYAKGAIEQHTVYQVVIRVGVCVSLVLLVMCYT